jgi:hypothetical protein
MANAGKTVFVQFSKEHPQLAVDIKFFYRAFAKRRSRRGVHLTAQLAIRCLIANYCKRRLCDFKGLSQDGGQPDFSKKPPRLYLNNNIWNEPNFGQISARSISLDSTLKQSW